MKGINIVIAPQHFKESITGLEAAKCIEAGVKRIWPDANCVLVPVADGGDGTLETLVQHSQGEIVEVEVTGPLGDRVIAQWGAMGDGKTAVIEMAQASGLALLEAKQRDPRNTTTFGVGEVFKAALDDGRRQFIVGIGGSATNDGGAGFAQALGASLLDNAGRELPPGGIHLASIASINISGLDARIQESTVQVACDVNNPLCGPNGASAVFGPQKGADPKMVQELDSALARYATVLKRDVGVTVSEKPGAGAAGGLGAGLMAFAQATLRSGADIVLEVVGLERLLEKADMVIVGEGAFDASSVFDKAPVAVAKRAKQRRLPVIGIAGSLGAGYEKVHDHGIDAVFSIMPVPMTLEKAVGNAAKLITSAAEEVCRAITVGSDLGLRRLSTDKG